MPRYRAYIDTDVLTEARKRFHHVHDLHDGAVVAFSGGKDSLAVLHLERACLEERGELPVRAVFHDEEVIPDSVVDLVASYRNLDWLDLEWWCVQKETVKYVLGEPQPYVQWDSDRPHVRPMPDWAITETDLGHPPGPVSRDLTDSLMVRNVRGKAAILTGVRADESSLRYRSCVNKLNDNYIGQSPTSKRVALCRPIFDWAQNDVFRYFYDTGIPYAPFYDAQVWTGTQLRIHSALARKRPASSVCIVKWTRTCMTG
jgi:predicted phosphoadenosine phosphosulfate sulfurtransferase